MREYVSDILIVGASFGGISAAIAACKAGSRVILTEETSWLGGQATSQGVPLDEHPWIEQYGLNESYRDFRRRIRDFYRRNYTLSFEANKDERFNPGACWVSALGFEPRVGQLVIEELLSQYKTAGLLTVWKNTKPAKVFEENDQIQAISFSSETDEKIVFAKYFLDATELGDLLELGSVEHVIGAESQSDTGEPLALDKANPQKQQPFTYIIAVEIGEEDSDTIEKPSEYEFFKSNFDHISAFCDSVQSGKIIGNGLPNGLFSKVCNDGKYHPDLWNFRRYFYKGNFDNRFFLSDVTALMVGNEYKDGVLCGVSESERNYHISQSRELSKSLVYYLQKEVPFNGKYGIFSAKNDAANPAANAAAAIINPIASAFEFSLRQCRPHAQHSALGAHPWCALSLPKAASLAFPAFGAEALPQLPLRASGRFFSAPKRFGSL